MSNETIRAKEKIHALVSDYEGLVVTVGATFSITYMIIFYEFLKLNSQFFSDIFIFGAIIVWIGMLFLLKEHEAETGEKTFWLHDENL